MSPNTSPAAVTTELRRVAKSINFGIVYGISAFGLSQQLSIPMEEAQAHILLDGVMAVYSSDWRLRGANNLVPAGRLPLRAAAAYTAPRGFHRTPHEGETKP